MTHRQSTANNSGDSVYSEENRKNMAILTMKLFQLWELTTDEQLNLLGFSSSSRAVLSKYKKGTALPATRDLLDRVGWLMAIHKALGLLYPDKSNANLKYGWVSYRNKVFNNLTPLEIMKEEGLIGIAKIARYLDNLRGK